jgi:hypothetical protein
MNVTTLPLLLFIFLSFIQSAPVDAGIGLGEEFSVNSGEEVVLKRREAENKISIGYPGLSLPNGRHLRMGRKR